jgi:hypothetical protein
VRRHDLRQFHSCRHRRKPGRPWARVRDNRCETALRRRRPIDVSCCGNRRAPPRDDGNAQVAAIAGRVPNGSIRPFDALQDPPSEQAGSARKRSLAEGVCCARRVNRGPIGNFCFGRTPGLSQRSPRSASRAFAISRLGHQALDSHHWGRRADCSAPAAAIRLPPPPRLDPGAARASRSRRPVRCCCLRDV